MLVVIKRSMNLVGVALLLGSAALSATAELLVSEAYVRGLPPGQKVTAAFMALENKDNKPVSVVAASSDSAERAEIHAHVHNNGMMRMEKVDKITVPAGGQFILAPGEHHLMLINLLRPLKEGDSVSITLSLGDGSSQTLQLPVRSVLNEHRHH